MKTSSTVSISNKPIRFSQTVAVFFSAALLLLCVAGCAPVQQNDPKADMLDYYNIDGVRSFHSELQAAFTDTAQAVEKNDKDLQDKSISELTTLCDRFIAVKDVPSRLEPYHNKMVAAATQIEVFGQNLKDDKLVEAAGMLPNIQSLLAEAQVLLPSTQ